MRAISKNKAFTLVELLIVIAIVGMLAVLSIAGYSSYRKNALSDFAVEGLIAKMNEMKESAIYGVNQDPQCFGVAFMMDAGNYKIGSFKQIFDTDAKIWDSGKMKWVDQGCDKNQVPIIDTLTTFDVDPMLNVASISIGSSSGSPPIPGDFFVRFSPPNGEFEVKANGSSDWGAIPIGATNITIVTQYGGVADVIYERDLNIQIESGQASYTNPNP